MKMETTTLAHVKFTSGSKLKEGIIKEHIYKGMVKAYILKKDNKESDQTSEEIP